MSSRRQKGRGAAQKNSNHVGEFFSFEICDLKIELLNIFHNDTLSWRVAEVDSLFLSTI